MKLFNYLFYLIFILFLIIIIIDLKRDCIYETLDNPASNTPTNICTTPPSVPSQSKKSSSKNLSPSSPSSSNTSTPKNICAVNLSEQKQNLKNLPIGPEAGIFIIKYGDKPVKPVKTYNIFNQSEYIKLANENPKALTSYIETQMKISEMNKYKDNINPVTQFIYMPRNNEDS